MRLLVHTQLPFTAALLLSFAATVTAHGHNDGYMGMEMGSMRPTITPAFNGTTPESYFQLKDHSAWLLIHIALMTIDWVFILPIGVMLSISRSRFSLPVHFIFLVVNAIAVLLVTYYNAQTPDLYQNNAHHKLGWLVTWVIGAQFGLGIIRYYTGPRASEYGREREALMPVSTEAMAEHERYHRSAHEIYRFSNDSGQGTEPHTESLRSHSVSSHSSEELQDVPLKQEEAEVEKHGLIHGTKLDRFLSRKIPGLTSSRVRWVFGFFYNAVDRLILPVGFAVLATGFVTYSGLFLGAKIFSGLAHIIKGGVFFWYGILTLGRWAGCFADIGWAWNIKPISKNRPSAEFVESFLIFFYGATNVFLEHLAAWGSAWSAQDLEHISITIMFIGGGLCGMLIESHKIRSLLNTTSLASNVPSPSSSANLPPKSYAFSMNPLPGLLILLLGLMMSSHHQESMVSTMIHKQWGTLLVGAAFARGATYVLLYISPPTSVLPGRPPTELVTAFALMAGGAVFMASARDVVESIELHGLDAMFIFTVAMGLIMFLMAWVIVVLAVKGWAVRREVRWGKGVSVRVGREREWRDGV